MGATNIKPVVIIGGGLSGLASGAYLSTHGIPVVVLEQKPVAGGRAYSYIDSTTGDTVDNGQHLLIAGYQKTMQFLEMIGTKHLLRIQRRPRLLFHHPQRGFKTFTLPAFPSPVHLLWGILSTDLLSIRDRLNLVRAGLALQKSGRDDGVHSQTVEQWLDSQHQSAECKRSFWEPLAVSIMNEKTATASASAFLHSMREAFLTNWKSAAAALPVAGLSQLYVDGACGYIAGRGGSVRCNADVVSIVRDGDRVSGVELKDGERIECSAVVCALPWYRIGALLPTGVQMDRPTARVTQLGVSPIVSIHLWFAREVMHDEFVGLVGRRVQWFFNRRLILHERGKGGHISATISAAHEYVELTNTDLVAIAVEDLRSVYPEASTPPTHAVVIREKRATYSSTPDSERARPGNRTSLPNLFLAGDWTDTGLPATIEGAIVSAERCAQLVKRWLVSSPA